MRTGPLLGLYRKMHIPDEFRSFLKKFYFTPRRSGLPAHSIRNSGRIATLVCWDQWVSRSGFGLAALTRRRTFIFYPTAIRLASCRRKAQYGRKRNHDAVAHDAAFATLLRTSIYVRR